MGSSIDLDNLVIAYIGGGSKNWAPLLMCDLALQDSFCGTVRLYDIDAGAAELNRQLGGMLSEKPETKKAWKYEVAQTLMSALAGADFVIISILPGTFEEMRSDVHTPEKYGIYQSVGDTVGPAGLMRALRTIPLFREMALQIKAYAPDAWVINYTNPMTLCVRTLYEVFPEIKAFGCCHNVFAAQHLLACAVRDILGISGTARQDVKVNVLGINHFTWIDQASYQSADIMPAFREFADRHAIEGYDVNSSVAWKTDVYECANKVGFDLFRRYGVIPASSDRHISEFFPPWYLKDPDTVKAWKFNLTPVSLRITEDAATEKRRKDILAGSEAFPLLHSGEEGLLQIKALLGLGDFVTNINMPNCGQMTDLPDGCIVETNALLTRDFIRPVFAGKLPLDLHSLLIRHVSNQELILQSALGKDKELAFRAFINDPLVTTGLEDSRTLFEEMLRNTARYLPGWDVA
jgi:galacturan 1,4-alpha-galacturonidase